MMRRVFSFFLFLLAGCLLFAACNYRPAPMQIIDDADEFELILQDDKEKQDEKTDELAPAQENQTIPDTPPADTTLTAPPSPEQETSEPAEEEAPGETEAEPGEDEAAGRTETEPDEDEVTGETATEPTGNEEPGNTDPNPAGNETPGNADTDPAGNEEPGNTDTDPADEETGAEQSASESAENTETPSSEGNEEDTTEEVCKHPSREWIAGQEATCTEPGVLEHYHCPDCGQDLDEANNPIPDLTIEKTKHNFENNQCKDCSIYRESKDLNISGDSVTGIGACGDSRVVLPGSVTQIENSAFNGCGFTEIVLHAGITRIGAGAFANCNLQTIVFLGTEAQWDAICKEEGWNGGKTFTIKTKINTN